MKHVVNILRSAMAALVSRRITVNIHQTISSDADSDRIMVNMRDALERVCRGRD